MRLACAALKRAPAAQANLIHYLWPLLIVFLAALIPGNRLRPRHLAAAALGLVATALVVGTQFGVDTGADALVGYALALTGALVWASYSVVSRRFAAHPTEGLSLTLIAAALVAAACHGLLETTVWPSSPAPWIGAVG